MPRLFPSLITPNCSDFLLIMVVFGCKSTLCVIIGQITFLCTLLEVIGRNLNTCDCVGMGSCWMIAFDSY